MGVYVLNPVAWDYLTPGEPMGMPQLLEVMRQAGRPIHCFREPCDWLDIGRQDDYAIANEIFQSRRVDSSAKTRPEIREARPSIA